jgi:hypothetical protein
MAVADRQIPITSPCPIALDQSGVSPGDRQLHCSHCVKDVHLLSQMSEAEARKFMRDHDGENLCVSYNVRRDGRIAFRQEAQVVPMSRLFRAARQLPAAASLGGLLAACAPHGLDAFELKSADEVHHVVTDPTIPLDEPCDPVTAVEGGIKIQPIAEEIDPDTIPRPGGIAVRPIVEEPMPKRGGIKRIQAIDEDWP